jgi:hypothetical protein
MGNDASRVTVDVCRGSLVRARVWARGRTKVILLHEGKTKDVSAFEQGMVVGARHTGLCQELQRCWIIHTQQFQCVSRMVHDPKDIQTTWHDCGKDWIQHGPCGTLSKPCRVHALSNWGYSEGKNIKKVWCLSTLYLYCIYTLYTISIYTIYTVSILYLYIVSITSILCI